ncbi:MAG: right-handed parallel beta-helix repeat-containing protein, partial [Paenibacillaceae bacterium]|nr:right-handed parallel beta-helix repeat-containing protein [Paenibacillaceae bacterium]
IRASEQANFATYTALGRATSAFPYRGIWTLDLDSSASYRYLRYYKTVSGETGAIGEFRVAGEQDTSKIPNEVPTASSLAVSQPVQVGETIAGSYVYDDPDGDAEGGTLFRWLIGDAEGSFYPVTDSTTDQFVLDEDAYAGMYVAFEVTPIDAQGNSGEVQQSEPALILPRTDQTLDTAWLEADRTTLLIGEWSRLIAYGEHLNGREANMALAHVKYESSNSGVIAVSQDGMATAVGTGSASLKAIVELEGIVAESDPISFTVSAAPVQASYYVDPQHGNDANDGSLLQPFRTIPRAQAEVRLANGNMTGNIVVYLREGTYELDSPLLFDQEDSGTNGYEVVYQAYGQEKPVISGGQTVTGWTLHDPVRNIYKAELDLPVATRQLFVNGQRAIRARSDNGLPNVVQIPEGYTTSMVEMADWAYPNHAELVFKEGFTNPRNVIASVYADEGVATITMQEPGWTYNRNKGGTQPKLPVYIENAYELLDEPGEWYLAPSGQTLYYKPRAGENVAVSAFEIPVLEELVKLEGTLEHPVRHIRFEGIDFTLATWLAPGTAVGHPDAQSNILRYGQTGVYRNETFSGAAVSLRMAQDIVLEHNRFAKLGGAAINMFEGSQHNRVSGSVFTDISGSGLQIGEPNRNNFYTIDPEDSRYVLKNNVVMNNYIAHIGIDYQSSVGIFGGYTDGLYIAHNEISDVPYSGITLGWGWSNAITSAKDNRIVNNYVHDVMQELHDGAAIYTLSAQPGSVIKGNYINHGTDPGGIYLDQGSSYFHVTDNVVSQVSQWLKLTSANNINNVIQLNDVDNNIYSDAGAHNIIGRTTSFPSGSPPPDALRIMAHSGIESRYNPIRPFHDTDLVAVNSPAGATIDTETVTATVYHAVTQITVDVDVNAGAGWKLYADEANEDELPGNVMDLLVGVNTAYIRVTAADQVNSRIYKLLVTRL